MIIGRAPKLNTRTGFTIVELVIAIAVIGILVTLAIFGFTNVRKTAAIQITKSDLINAIDTVEASSAATNGLSYSTDISNVKKSPKVNLAVNSTTLNRYSNLTPVQNGVLLAQICQDLLDAGYGNGLNTGGGTDPYISGCGNWNKNLMQFTAWDTKSFSTPVSNTAFTDYANSVPAADSYHPNQQSTIQNFYRKLNNRFILQGGTYPIATFWDYWANSGNGGVMKQDLPAPEPGLMFCIQATHSDYADITWHAWNNAQPTTGSCENI